MNDQAYIREAVELANGWQTERLGNQRTVIFIPTKDAETVLRIGYLDEQHVLDALVAQLLRQANAIVSGGKFTFTGDTIRSIKDVVNWAESRGGL